MPSLTRKQRLKIAFGGFLSFIGFGILILMSLIITRTINVESAFQQDLMVNVLAVIGILDILAGVLLLRSR
jgi:hypothetical protein